ncbi:phosphoribosyltransferase family protein [Ramlibacter sp.]|uniref:phosphoribosyltransferase family protein n=1 Tax=Ramlibacter sp. TaxID=1917967 RepID=UPI003D0AB2F0
MLGGWLSRGLALAPSRCGVCGAWPDEPVCGECTDRFAAPRSRCLRCALPVPGGVEVCGACIIEPPPLDACHAAVDYAYPWSELVTRYKFGGEPGLASALAKLAQRPDLADAVARADLLLPMPLSRERLAERGFNQALQLARTLAAPKVRADWLLRLRHTAPQTALGRPQREANVRGAFALDPLRAPQVRGKAVLLVDDVMTSGASLHAAARAVRGGGAVRVSALVIARTPP